MEKAGIIFKSTLKATYLFVLHIVAVYFIGQWLLEKYVYLGPQSAAITARDPTEATKIPTPLPVPSIFYDPEPPANTNQSFPVPNTGPGLMIPVAGVSADKLQDTFADSRSGGRVHDAIDIMAPQGTPVLAVADGTIAKFFESDLGGITIYQLSSDSQFIFYYAHLQKRADGLSEKAIVKKGQIIGFVGDTGNATPGNFHLHFSISRVTDPKRYWEGTYINPFPILRSGTEIN